MSVQIYLQFVFKIFVRGQWNACSVSYILVNMPEKLKMNARI